jgi:hypothetical protein
MRVCARYAVRPGGRSHAEIDRWSSELVARKSYLRVVGEPILKMSACGGLVRRPLGVLRESAGE